MARKFFQLVQFNYFSKSHFQSTTLLSCQKRNYGSKHSLPGSVDVDTRIFKVGSYNINVAKVGHGPKAVFCLPGILGAMELQTMDQVKRFDTNTFTVYAWDQPGYAKSRPPERNFNDESLKQDSELLADLFKKLGHEKYSVLGWSGGGSSALLTAINHPELVDNLVIWGAFAKVDQKDMEIFKWFQKVENWGGKMKDALIDYYGEEFFVKHWEIWMDLFIRIYTHGGGELCSKKLHYIKCPTFIIHGDQDALIHPSHGNFLHENIKDSKLLIWKKGKHNVHLRYPQEFNEVVQQFLLRSYSNSNSNSATV